MELLFNHPVYSWVDLIVFFIFMLSVGYVFVFAVASLRKVHVHYPETDNFHRFCVLIPFWKGVDQHILDSVASFRSQAFPSDKFDIVVVGNELEATTKTALENQQVILLLSPTAFKNYKSAVAYAVRQLNPANYDVLIMMDANNTVDNQFLTAINKAFHSGGMAIQTHRVSKKYTNNLSVLTALMEEINNSIFRRGHVNMGFSSSLIGTGMAFRFDWFLRNAELDSQTDLSKQLESRLLKQGIYIEYLEKVFTYDEQIKSVSAYNKLRKEWYSPHYFTKKNYLKDLPRSLFAGNLDYFDKIIQWLLPSKILLLGFIIIIAGGLTYFEMPEALKWWILLGTLLFSYVLAVPDKLINFRTFWALLMLPLVFLSVFFSKLFSRFSKS